MSTRDNTLLGELLRIPVLFAKALIAIAVSSLLVVGGTWAALTMTTTPVDNQITSKLAAVRVVENGTEVTGGTSQVPFGASSKKVQLTIPQENCNGVVRVMFVPQVRTANSTAAAPVYEPLNMPLLSPPANNVATLGDFSLHFSAGWDQDWTFKSGYFYYKHVLKSGQTTPTLLEGMTVTNSNTAPYVGRVELVISADVVQANPADSPALWGVTVDQNGNVSV